MPLTQEDPLTTFHFWIECDGIREAVFQQVSLPDIELEVTDYSEGGRNDHVHRLPGRAKVGDITLRNGVTPDNRLWQWYKKILQGNFERRNLSIVMVNQKKEEQMRWNLIEALPVKWTGSQLSSNSPAAVIQSLQLTHRGLQIS